MLVLGYADASSEVNNKPSDSPSNNSVAQEHLNTLPPKLPSSFTAPVLSLSQ